MQWAFFPLALILTPASIYGAIEAGVSTAVLTYLVIVVLGLFFADEWPLPHKRDLNRPQVDFSNYVINGTVAAYIR